MLEGFTHFTEENQWFLLKERTNGRIFQITFCSSNGLSQRETDVLKSSFPYFHISSVFTFSGQVQTHKYTFVVYLFLFTFLEVERKKVASGDGNLLWICDVKGNRDAEFFFFFIQLKFFLQMKLSLRFLPLSEV